MQLQQYKQGVIPPSVPAIEEKPKENGQVEIGDQVANVNNKVIVFPFFLLLSLSASFTYTSQHEDV